MQSNREKFKTYFILYFIGSSPAYFHSFQATSLQNTHFSGIRSQIVVEKKKYLLCLISLHRDLSLSLQYQLKNAPNPASFCLFLFFSQHNGKYSTNLTIKSVDGVLGTRTRGGRIVSADESTELCVIIVPHLN